MLKEEETIDFVALQMQIFTRLDKVAEAVKGWNLDVMPDNASATLQQVSPSCVNYK